MAKTVAKALKLIDELTDSGTPLGVTELSRRLSLNKSTVYRLLRTLGEFGYVRQRQDTNLYEMTLKPWEVGLKLLGRRDLKQAARPIIEALSSKTEETVHLSILDGTDAVYIDKVDSQGDLRIHTPIGGRVPVHCGSTGKALIAFADESVLKCFPVKLFAATQRTITSMRTLRKELAQVRALGYATNRGEWRLGISGVASPIRDHNGAVVASIGISGPADLYPEKRLHEFGVLVMDAAALISAEMGYRAETPADVSGSREKKPAIHVQQNQPGPKNSPYQGEHRDTRP